MEKSREALLEKSVPFLIFAITGIVFFPVINWLLQQTVVHEQLLHAFLVFLLSGALLIYERRISIRMVYRFSDTSQNLLILSYALLVLAIFTKFNLIVLASLCLVVGSFLLFIFGRDQQRLIVSGIGAFALFAAIAVFLPVLDWPLRTIAGKWAAFGLSLVGQNVELGLVQGQSGPMLMLLSNGRPFHVAAECNGFGMLGSSLLMALIIVLYRKIALFDKIGWMVMAMIIGLFFNIVRIILIVLIAPNLEDSSYMLMHEIVGLCTTYGGLAALYFLLMPRDTVTDSIIGGNSG
jgi:exosortase/archaeosortase family protein